MLFCSNDGTKISFPSNLEQKFIHTAKELPHYRKRALAVVWNLSTLRTYLRGDKPALRTDPHLLKRILDLADSSGRLARWHLQLAEYDYEMEHLPEAIHMVAHELSCLGRSVEEQDFIDEETPRFVTERNHGDGAAPLHH